MEVTNSEKRILVALRVLKPFFYKKLYNLYHIDYDCRDGDYIIFTTGKNGKTFFINLFPVFNIFIYKKLSHYRYISKKKPINLIEEKEKYEEFKYLPGNYRKEDELKNILIGYTQFIEKHFLK